MLEREFGSTGVKVPVIGQGTWQMRRNGLEALRTGIELGMTYIDTAEMYTGSEEVIAEAIRGIRNKIFLVSKVLPSNVTLNARLVTIALSAAAACVKIITFEVAPYTVQLDGTIVSRKIT